MFDTMLELIKRIKVNNVFRHFPRSACS